MKCFLVLSTLLVVSLAAPSIDGAFDMEDQAYHHKNKETWNGKPSRPSEWTKPTRPENDLILPDWINNMWNNNGPQVQPVRPWERPQVQPPMPSPIQPWPIQPTPDRPGHVNRPQRPEFVPIQILRELFQQWMTALREQGLNNNGNTNVPQRPMPSNR
jgi:hypothetical protein